MFKQGMARVNINILGISELKWTGMGEFNSDDHYIYYCGQESLRRNGVAIIVNKSPKCSTWMQSQKRQNDLCSFPRQTIQYHSNPRLCPAGAAAAQCTGGATVRRCPTSKGGEASAKTVGDGAILGQDLLAYIKKYGAKPVHHVCESALWLPV